MHKLYKTLSILVVISTIALIILFKSDNRNQELPLIAIANYGPHSSLQETIEGLKEKLNQLGYVEDKTIQYEVADVNFETSLIIQMLSKLKASKPNLIVAISTPVAQAAKNLIKDIPIVYADVTDPLEAGLIADERNTNITGASDKQDLSLMLEFARKLLPDAKKIGLLYSSGEANDLSLLKMLQAASKPYGIQVVAVPVEHTRDVVTRMKLFKDNVDFIYTGSSGAIQASLPAIVSTAESMKLPLFNFNGEEVITHNALASYGVSHKQVGANAAFIVGKILKGEKPANIKPLQPNKDDHIAYISRKRANKINLKIPTDLQQVTIIE